MLDVNKQNRMNPLAKRLLVLGKTQGELAKDLRVSQQTVSGYVNGTMKPHPKRIRPLSIALDLRTEDLVELLTR